MKHSEHQKRTQCTGTLLLLMGLACNCFAGPAAAPAVNVAVDHLAALGLAGRASAIAQRVSANLRSLGYGSGSVGLNALTVQISPVRKDTTPVGFSMSFGDSDPRGKAFQRAAVVDLSCHLEGGTKGQVVTQTIGLAADPMNRTAQPTLSEQEAVDQIGGVCLTLLEEQHIRPVQPSPTASKWQPPVRVETLPATASESSATTVSDAPADAQQQAPVVRAVGPKKILIHSQGNPLELEFGYKRR